MALRSTSSSRATAMANLEQLLRWKGYNPDDYLLEDLADDVLERGAPSGWTVIQGLDWAALLPGYQKDGLFDPITPERPAMLPGF